MNNQTNFFQMQKVHSHQRTALEKRTVAASIAVLSAVAVLVTLFLIMLSRPNQKSIVLYPGGGRTPDWSYYDADGRTGRDVLDEYGYQIGIEGLEGNAIAAKRVMTEELSDAHLLFEYTDALICVYLDGTLLYSDLPEACGQGIEFLSPGAEDFSDEYHKVLVSLPVEYQGKTLTVLTYTSPENTQGAYSVYPILRNDTAMIGQPIASAVIRFIFCGVLLAVAVSILLLQIFSAMENTVQWPTVLLALYFLCMMVKMSYGTEASMYSIGTNLYAYLLSISSVSFLLLFCSCYMRKKFRLTLTCVVLLHEVFIIALTVHNARAGLFYETGYNGRLEFMLLLLFLIFCMIEWKAKKSFFKVMGKGLLILTAVYVSLMTAAYLLMRDNDAGLQLLLPFSSLFHGYPRGFNNLLAGGIAIAGIAVVFLRFLQERAEKQAEQEMLSLKNKLILTNLRNMKSSMRQTEEQRHELKHHIAALQILLKEEKTESAKAYLDTISDAAAKSTERYFTDNLVINAVLSTAAERAEQLTVPLTVSVMVPQVLYIPDSDLCSLLYNMLENALNACEAVPIGERQIRIKIQRKDSFLSIVCTNSKRGKIITAEDGTIRSTRQDSSGHGYGISIMKKICEHYHSILLTEYTENSFTVRTNLHLPEDEETT